MMTRVRTNKRTHDEREAIIEDVATDGNQINGHVGATSGHGSTGDNHDGGGNGPARGQSASGLETEVPQRPRSKQPAGAGITRFLKALRKKLTLQMMPWAEDEWDDVQKSALGILGLRYISLYSSKLAMFWETSNRALVPVKKLNWTELENDPDRSIVVSWLKFQGWTSLWDEEKTEKFSPMRTRDFYANLWVEFSENKRVAIHSLVGGVHIHWSSTRINELLGTPNKGVVNFVGTKWDAKSLGVPEKDVMSFFNYVSTLSLNHIPLNKRIMLTIVTNCVCGKSARAPSRTDFYVAYKLIQKDTVNYGALFMDMVVDAANYPTKALSFANLLYYMLAQEDVSVDVDDETNITDKDIFKCRNIEQTQTSRNRFATGADNNAPVSSRKRKGTEPALEDFDVKGEIAELKATVALLERDLNEQKIKYAKLKAKIKDAVGIDLSSDEES